jgi:hypothetical protein
MFATLVASLGSDAQTTDLIASIPFEFRVGSAALPPGDYRVQHTNGVLTLRTATGEGKAAVALANSAHRRATDKPSTLVFNRYGKEYFLSKVWGPASPTGHVLPPGKLEREMISRSTFSGTTDVALRPK